MGSEPPIIAINVGDLEDGSPKDKRANISLTKEFVVNLVHRDIAYAMNVCAVDFPAGVSELNEAGLTSLESRRIAEARVQIECKLFEIVKIGENHIIIVEIVYLHIDDAYMDKERMRVRTPDMDPVGRMHGAGRYARTTNLF